MAKSHTLPHRPIVYTIFISAVLLLSMYGFNVFYQNSDVPSSFWDLFYYTLRLFFLEHDFNDYQSIPLALNIARFLAPMVLAAAIVDIFFTRLIIITNTIIVRYFYRNHIIFCGLGLKSKMVIDSIRTQKSKIVVIEINPNNYYFPDMKQGKIKVFVGDAINPRNLAKAGVTKASKVFIATGNDIINLNIAKSINSYLSINRKNKATQKKLIVDFDCRANEQVFKELQDKTGDSIEINSFSIFRKFAANVVDKYCPDQYTSLCNKHDPPAHILIFGFDETAWNITIEVAQLYHFGHLKTTNITIVSADIEVRKKAFYKHYQCIEKIFKLNFLTEDQLFSNQFEEYTKSVCLCIVCTDNDSESFLMAKRLRQAFFSRNVILNNLKIVNSKNVNNIMSEPKIVSVSSNQPDIVGLFQNLRLAADFLNIKLERMYETVFASNILEPDSHIEDIAKQIFNIYKKLPAVKLEEKWQDRTDEEKDFDRWAARHLKIKLRFVGAKLVPNNQSGEIFNFENISEEQLNTIAQLEHVRWNAEKLITGFVPGIVEAEEDINENLKRILKWHRAIKEWENLPISEKDKDKQLSDLKKITSNLQNHKVVSI